MEFHLKDTILSLKYFLKEWLISIQSWEFKLWNNIFDFVQ